MKLLNQIKYRIAVSLIIGMLVALYTGFKEGFTGDIFFIILVAAVVVYIPITLIWAIVSTFFMDEKNNSDDNVIDS